MDRQSAPAPLARAVGSASRQPTTPTHHERRIGWCAVVVGCRDAGRAVARGTGADCGGCGAEDRERRTDRDAVTTKTREEPERKKKRRWGDEKGESYVLEVHGDVDREQDGGVAERRDRAQSRLGAGALRRSARRSRDEARDGDARSRSHRGLPTGRDLCRSGTAGAPRTGALRAGSSARDPRRPALRRPRPTRRSGLPRRGRPPAALRHHRAAGRQPLRPRPRPHRARAGLGREDRGAPDRQRRGRRKPLRGAALAPTRHRRSRRERNDRDRGRADPEVTRGAYRA